MKASAIAVILAAIAQLTCARADLNLAPVPASPRPEPTSSEDATATMLNAKAAPPAAKRRGIIGFSAGSTCADNGTVIRPGEAGYDACVDRASERAKLLLPALSTQVGPLMPKPELTNPARGP